MTARAAPLSAGGTPGSIPIARPEPLLKVVELAYLLFEKPDLDLLERFGTDFGFVRAERSADMLYLRGAGSSPWCYAARQGPISRYVGAGFRVAARADLEVIAVQPGASSIVAVEGPGGGERVTLTDPNGWRVDFVFGRAEVAPLPGRLEPFAVNTPVRKARVNQPIRPELRPTSIFRVGHVVLQVPDFNAGATWYMRHLGLIPSDVQCLHDGSPALAFMRLDLGDALADHHTVVIAGGLKAAYMHSAYEAMDIDAIGQGQQVLKERGWQHVWGIGRHKLGSQIFDYWRDPWGQELEHYADGDVFDSSQPTAYSTLDRASLWMWGDDVPGHFRPRMTPDMLIEVIRGVRRGILRRETLAGLKRAYEKPPRRWLR